MRKPLTQINSFTSKRRANSFFAKTNVTYSIQIWKEFTAHASSTRTQWTKKIVIARFFEDYFFLLHLPLHFVGIIVHQKLPKIAKNCQKWPKVANSCQQLPTVANSCQQLPTVSKSCQTQLGYRRTNVCTDRWAS